MLEGLAIIHETGIKNKYQYGRDIISNRLHSAIKDLNSLALNSGFLFLFHLKSPHDFEYNQKLLNAVQQIYIFQMTRPIFLLGSSLKNKSVLLVLTVIGLVWVIVAVVQQTHLKRFTLEKLFNSYGTEREIRKRYNLIDGSPKLIQECTVGKSYF